jgi:hypothetical protein
MNSAIKTKYSTISLLFLLLFTASRAGAQQVEVATGDTLLHLYEPFSISVSIFNEEFRTLSAFPDYPLLKKGERFTESTTENSNEGAIVKHSITQYYYPQEEGYLHLPERSMQVNDSIVKIPALSLHVLPPLEGQEAPEWYETPLSKEEQEALPAQDVYLLLYLNKDTVYIGEEFHLRLSLLVSKQLRAAYEFPDIGKQMLRLSKTLTPVQCWVEDFTIHQLYAQEVTFQGKKYDSYTLFAASFFPFQTGDIVIPAPYIEGNKAGKGIDTGFRLYADSARVHVKALPPHPLATRVPVGNFYLDEKLSIPNNMLSAVTGHVVEYSLAIVGYGNIASVPPPAMQVPAGLDVYENGSVQNIKRAGTSVFGTKLFRYRLVARNPGKYPLGQYIAFVYFNPSEARYDTLRPRSVLEVVGAPLPDAHKKQIKAAYEAYRPEAPWVHYLHLPARLWLHRQYVLYSLTGIAILCLLLFLLKNRRP